MPKSSGFKQVHRVSEALGILFEKHQFIPEPEDIATEASFNRVIANEIRSSVNLPGFIRSAMDGFAIIASETHGASETTPIPFKIFGTIDIGDQKTPKLSSMTVMRISTGAPLPKGADAVLKLEDCEIVDSNTIEVVLPLTKWKNVAQADEDIKVGDLLFKAGHLMRPYDIGLLEAAAINQIRVMRKPRISTLSTGSELIPSGHIPKIGQVVDSNRPAINAWLTEFNVELVKSKQHGDNLEELTRVILEMASEVDLIITTGGTSVGTRDYLPQIIQEIGEYWVHGVAIRPGKPITIGHIRNDAKRTTIVALPGYPLAAFLNFNLFVVPLLEKWTKQVGSWKQKTIVTLGQKVPSVEGMRDFVRLKRDGETVKILRITGAGILSSLTNADYLLEIPEDNEGYPEGAEVEVIILRPENE